MDKAFGKNAPLYEYLYEYSTLEPFIIKESQWQIIERY